MTTSSSFPVPSSPHPDSAVDVHGAEIAGLKAIIEQLQSAWNASQQECSLWREKHQDARDEVSRLSGPSSKQGREIKRLQGLDSQRPNLVAENSKLIEALDKAQGRTSEAELRVKIAENASKASQPDRSATAELDSLRSQFIDPQQAHSKLKQTHTGLDYQVAIQTT